jgi:threonine synthase
MSHHTGRFACVRCHADVDGRAPWNGCPRCAVDGIHANVLPTYTPAMADDFAPQNGEPGVFRYRRRLPVAGDVAPVSLQEGGTPLLAAERLQTELDLGALWFKDETRNPTWSYKDRLAAVAVTDAVARGADTVALATTGNHGAATAAYAAAAGLRCVVLTLASVPTTMKVLMQSYGAEVLALQTGPQRWDLLHQAVEAWGWVPISGFLDPPIGSNACGVDGYKTIAFEVVETLGEAPDAVVIPTAYADGLVGVHRGFTDLADAGMIAHVPRMIAVDPFGAYAAALDDDGGGHLPRVDAGPTVSFSIGTPIATHQGVAALRESRGFAVGVGDDEAVMAAQRRIGASCGLFLEASSATALVAIERLRGDGRLDETSRVVCVATSSGLKDVQAGAGRLEEVPLIAPNLADLERSLLPAGG